MLNRVMICVHILCAVLMCGFSSGEVLSINTDKPRSSNNFWDYYEVGWVWQPTETYSEVSSVKTNLGDDLISGASREVTLTIYDGLPFMGGSVIVSGTFDTDDGNYAGFGFAPFDLLAGEDYFIGMKNVENLYVNSASEGMYMPPFYGESDGDMFANVYPDPDDVLSYPMLKFEYVPEPMTGLLMAAGIGYIALKKRP